MPTQDFANIGEVLDFQVLKGTITAIDSATDTCTVTVAGSSLTALIFYHCKPDSIERSNGAIEGAAKGFKVDDEVIIILNPTTGVAKVIGHTDGIRACTTEYVKVQVRLLLTDWAFLWDIANEQVVEIPNIDPELPSLEMPCNITDPSWIAFTEHSETVSEPLWVAEVVGREYEIYPFQNQYATGVDPMMPYYSCGGEESFVETISGEYPSLIRTEWQAQATRPHRNQYTETARGPKSWLLAVNIPDAGKAYEAIRTSSDGYTQYIEYSLENSNLLDLEVNTTYTVHSPYGPMTSYADEYRRIPAGSTGFGENTEFYPAISYFIGVPHNVAATFNLPENAAGRKEYVAIVADGAFSEKNIANVIIHQNKTIRVDGKIENIWHEGDQWEQGYWLLEETQMATYFETYPFSFNRPESLPATYENEKTITIHAQAKTFSEGTTGIDFATEGRSSLFEAALYEMFESAFGKFTPVGYGDLGNIGVAVSLVEI